MSWPACSVRSGVAVGAFHMLMCSVHVLVSLKETEGTKQPPPTPAGSPPPRV